MEQVIIILVKILMVMGNPDDKKRAETISEHESI